MARLVLATDLDAFAGLPDRRRIRCSQSARRRRTGARDAATCPAVNDAVRTASGAISADLVLEVGESLEDDDEFVAGLLGGFAAPLVGVLLLGHADRLVHGAPCAARRRRR